MSKVYNADTPFYLSRSIARAQRKLKELHIREQIYEIDQKLKSLKACEQWYPPQEVDDAQPLAVHSCTDFLARSSLYEETFACYDCPACHDGIGAR